MLEGVEFLGRKSRSGVKHHLQGALVASHAGRAGGRGGGGTSVNLQISSVASRILSVLSSIQT